MPALTALGWDDDWSAAFTPFVGRGLVPGRVTAEHKELYQLAGDFGESPASVSGRLRHEAARRADFPAVGDWAAVQPAEGDGRAVIHAVVPRRNKFSRRPPGESADEQILAANLDTLFVVTSLNRDLNPRRIERYLAAAELPGARTVLLLTKSDLHDRPDAVAMEYRGHFPGVEVHAISAHTGEGVNELADYFGPGRTAAMVGSSGVGKSTLLNRLLGEDRQGTVAVRADDDRGRHCTTHRELFVLPGGGLLIDNPGLRELQLWDETADPAAAFDEIARLAEGCQFRDCGHGDEPGCAVRQAIAAGRLAAERLESYLKLQNELAYQRRREDPALAREQRERERRVHRIWGKATRKRPEE